MQSDLSWMQRRHHHPIREGSRVGSQITLLVLLSVAGALGEEAQAKGKSLGASIALSVEAAPSWASRRDRVAPQLGDAYSVFQSLRHGEIDDVKEGVLLCNVQVHNPKRWDSFAAPDLNVALSIGKGPLAFKHTFVGPQDRAAYLFSIPRVNLPLRTKVSLAVTDRDVFQNELIGSDVDIFAGEMPLAFDGGTFGGECRVLTGEALEGKKKDAVVPVQEALAALVRKNTPRGDVAHLGFDKPKQLELHRRMAELAALTGWNADSLQEFFQEERKFVAAFQEAARPVVVKLRKEADNQKMALWGKDRLRVSRPLLRCDLENVKGLLAELPRDKKSQSAECLVEVTLEKRNGGATRSQAFRRSDFPTLLMDDGSEVELSSIGFLDVHAATQRGEMEEGAKKELTSLSSAGGALVQKQGAPKSRSKKLGTKQVTLKRGDKTRWFLVANEPLDASQPPLLRVPAKKKMHTLVLRIPASSTD